MRSEITPFVPVHNTPSTSGDIFEPLGGGVALFGFNQATVRVSLAGSSLVYRHQLLTMFLRASLYYGFWHICFIFLLTDRANSNQIGFRLLILFRISGFENRILFIGGCVLVRGWVTAKYSD